MRSKTYTAGSPDWGCVGLEQEERMVGPCPWRSMGLPTFIKFTRKSIEGSAFPRVYADYHGEGG